jgi:hypothetical protein
MLRADSENVLEKYFLKVYKTAFAAFWANLAQNAAKHQKVTLLYMPKCRMLSARSQIVLSIFCPKRPIII